MKKYITLMLCLVFLLSLTGCEAERKPAVNTESESGDTKDPGISEGNLQEGICELYLEVLEDLWHVDPGLNSEISKIGIDLSALSGLSETEKDYVISTFASKHDVPYIKGTWEELCEQGLIDKENLCWKDGLFFSIKTGDDGSAFYAQKWRSGLGAYFFGNCTAQKRTDGTWSYTIGEQAIS